ncbi:HD domain-containing phosphohydrolase [Undibacterium sp. SXout7W]|uniref:HD domain-containing phosphohydrolase n=1 Tax=Undibacterium sp. SXout7W TaxID=3413049 RepID=UPI003BF1AA5A
MTQIRKMNILIIDDDPTNLKFFSYLLKAIPDVEVICFERARDALQWSEVNEPDLVLVDYMMPEMDGLEFIASFREIPGKASIPLIMATADADNDVRYKALEMSANDFLTKPVNKFELRARVSNMLSLRQFQLEQVNRADWLAEEVRKATAAMVLQEKEIIHRLSRASEYRDPETGAHILRMAHYSKMIAKNLGLSAKDQELILHAAPMHDVGKMGIPDQILLKPGRLTDEEMTIMKTHAAIGAEILDGSESVLLKAATEIALSHHEKYDGSGYPRGLKGDDIPLFGRIVAVADVFDALTSSRPYKPAWDIDRACDLIRDSSGTHFDPACVQAFFSTWDEVLQIRAKHDE